MRSRTEWTRAARFTALVVVACLSALTFRAGTAQGGERKYLVMLASSPKQFPMTGIPTGGYINKEFIRRQYFEKNPNDNIGSFAEYWEEISYGDVTISGRVTDWLLLPWAIQPPLIDPSRQTEAGPPIDDDINNPGQRLSPANFADLNDDGVMDYGQAEAFNNARASTIVDLTGNPFNIDDGPIIPGPGSSHTTANAGKDVWKPGERFVDMDNDGRWDGFDENLNWMDHNGDGRPDNLGPWIDLNGDGEPNNAADCIYLPDSDNDGNPDCCPNGPGAPGCGGITVGGGVNACPSTRWTDPNGDEIIDCDGDGASDADAIAADPTLDDLPFVAVGDQCVAGEGDDILDRCQYTNHALPCRDPALDCNGEDPGPCCTAAHPPCAPVAVPRTPIPRCEFDDANSDNKLDIVEPFENFMRRWDPCLFDPDVKAPLNAQTARAHWIKVYDPNSPSAGTPISCNAPAYSADYGDSAYITNNYPGPADALVAEAVPHVIYGPHDPLNKLTPAQCVCSDGSPCQNIVIPGSPPIQKACPAGLHAVFNPPDQFTNMVTGTGVGTRYTTKFQAAGGAGGQASFATATPEPGTSTVVPGESEWYRQAWRDRYGVPDDQVPDWPQGFDPEGAPVPGGPQSGRPVPNTLRMIPYAGSDVPNYNAQEMRRFFSANFGGLNGDGTGWTSSCGNLAPVILFETGNTGTVGFETGCNHAILPDEVNGMAAPPQYFDGFVEHDDLPSSKYHMGGDMFLGEITSPFRSWYNLNNTGLGFPDTLDPFGETEDGVPIVRVPAIWGDDLGDHNPNTPSLQGDQVIPAAGPYATKIYGSLGRDGGNLLLLELLSRRTEPPFNNGVVWETWYGTHHPYAGPGTALQPNENLGFRDYNLDGLVDLGECRPAGSENYLADSDIGTGDTGTNTVYPFNRQRMLEDCVEILDESVDFDDFVDDVALNAVTCEFGTFPTLLPVQYLTEPADGIQNRVFADGLCSGIVLLPNLSHKPNDFPIAPSFYPIHNEDGLDDPEYADATFPRAPDNTPQIAWNIFFHDLVIAVDQQGEDPSGSIGNENFQTPYSAHEYLHSWEGFPDLYDYDVFAPDGPVINCPIGEWDVMAYGGLVHPSPILKEKPCTEWLKPVDITTVLTPGVDTPITFPPYELVRDESAYFYENESRPGERFYFYSVGRGFDDPNPLPLLTGYPGEGLLIQHTDAGSNPDALPLQQTNWPFTYLVVGADGEGELEAGTECGDDGDPFPGSTNNRQFNCNTNPPSRWYNENSCSGINILDVSNDGEGTSVVLFNWTPTVLPSIRFVDPPGGTSVNVSPGVRIYQVRTEATDVFGGTWIRLFHAPSGTDRSINSNGANYIGMVRKSGPGTNMEVVDWNINGVPDGPYRVFAELIPGPGADGNELAYTEPRAGRTNAGDGTMTINEVETNRPVASGLFGAFASAAAPLTSNASRFRAVTPTGQEVNFTTLGVQVNDQLATNAPFRENGATLRKPVMRSITGISDGGRTLQLSTAADLPAGPGIAAVTSWLITRAPRDARSESWVVQCINTAGTEWRVFSSLTQPQPPEGAPNQDPYPHAVTGQQYTSVNGAVKFTINAGATPFAIGDRFVFLTTGISAISNAVTIVGGVISENPVAVIEAAPLSGNPPLTVHFDGRNSFDPDGRPLTYRWNFGDGTPTSASSVVNHIYQNGGSYTAVLRVTNSIGVFGESQIDVNVTNNSPTAVAIATPVSGPIREVQFDGSQSSDLETDTGELRFEWEFGDGFVVGPGEPGEFISTTHFYGANGTYIAKLTVTDSGGKQDIDTVDILVGNTLPVPSITYTSLQGTSPHEVRFNGITSFDPDGDPITIEWIWGDGSPNETYPRTGVPGPPDDGIVPHTYRLPTGQTAATFNTTAIVRDNRGGSVAWPGVTITLSQAGVGASDPQAIFTITPEAPRVNQQFTADATLSFDRPAGSQIASYFWEWGDGQTSTGRIATHTYTAVGTYTIRLTVADGETPPNTDSGEKTLIVLGGSQPPPETENNPPTAVILVNPLEGIVGETSFAFDARSSTDPDGDELTFTWNFGDGTSAVGAQVSHVFDQIGNFSVRLTVRDEANATANAIQSVSVLPVGSNLVPVARIATGLRTGSAPVILSFDGGLSYDPNGDPLTYKWEFKRRGEAFNTAAGEKVNQLFQEADTYTVELEVTDSRGGSNRTAPEEITIAARVSPPVDNDNTEGRPIDGGPDDSANQRPGLGCGLGMVTSLFGMLLGLSLMAAAGRRQRP